MNPSHTEIFRNDLIDKMAIGKVSTRSHTSDSIEIPTFFLPYFKFQVEYCL